MVIVVMIIILLVTISIKSKKKEISTEEKVDEEKLNYKLPDTVYNDMEVVNVQMKYLKDNNETSVSLQIINNTEKIVENENVKIIWLDTNDNIITIVPVLIEKIKPKEAYNYEFIAKGDLTATNKIEIQNK